MTRGADETSPFHSQASAMADLLKEGGASVELRSEPGLNHLTVVQALADPAAPLGRLLGELVASS